MLAEGVPPTTVLGPLLALASLPHVSVKLSGLYDIDAAYPHWAARETVARVVDAYGPSRVVWGSDFPVLLDALSELEAFDLPTWVHDILSPDELDQVLGGNLLAILAECDPGSS
jgi:L-fuconolactonase